MIRHNGIEIDRVRQIIRHRNREKKFARAWIGGQRPVAFRIWEALIIGECTRDYLFTLVYGHDAGGGPNQGPNVLNVRICQWRSEFARMDLEWVSERRASVAYWQLVPTFNVQETADRILAHVV